LFRDSRGRRTEVEDARKLDCDVDAIALLGEVFRVQNPFGIHGIPLEEGDGDAAGSQSTWK